MTETERKTIAIIGASTDRKKYGNKAVRAYARAGWHVCPVHPREEEIEGFRAYHSIAEAPHPVHRVAMYLPPKKGLGLLEDIGRVHPEELWLNPGSESDALIKKAQALGLNVVQGCSILVMGMSPDDLPDQ